MKHARGIAISGVFTALAIGLMWIGALSGVGTYAVPLLAGIALIPVGQALGKKYHLLSFAAVSLLSFLLSADWEQNLMFAGLMGWYPILRPALERLKKPLRILLKLAIFNVMAVAVELLVTLVFVPTAEALWLLVALLLIGNVAFLIYDAALPKFEFLLAYKLRLMK